jgi:flagellar hook-associated protein 1 FlgK
MESNVQIDSRSNTVTGSYTIDVNGINLVDGTSYHPIHVSNEKNKYGFYDISYEDQGGVLHPLSETINSGKIGAILALRGGIVENTSGVPVDGIFQRTVSELDAFAKGIIESTNNLYAKNSTTRMDSNYLNLNPTNSIMSSGMNINEGAFKLVVYDIDGNVAASREISINVATTITGGVGSNSIQAQIEAQKDDNSDFNANNDIDDFINFNWATFESGDNAIELSMDPLSESRGYRFSIEDVYKDKTFSSGTNFAGAFGMNRFFDGENASTIDLNFKLKNNATLISAGYTDVAGDNRNALNMVQHQFENFDYKIADRNYHTTAYGMFDIIATEVGTATNSAIMRNETTQTLYNAIEMEYFSTSKVSIDEEMTNLIKYQTSYGAAAKVITTIDQMMQTLLGIKQ